MRDDDDILIFGPFELRRTQRELVRDGQPLRVGARALDILVTLLEQPGEIVDQRSLMAAVWPTTVVEDNALRVHISTLRKILGDGQQGARYIANVAGRGYCFVAPVLRQSQRMPAPPPLPVPAMRSAMRHLPLRLTRMIGRDAIVSAIRAELPRARLVTVVGPGGIGKTTVALAVAESLVAAQRDGVCFVDLSTIDEASQVVVALQTALGLPGLAASAQERVQEPAQESMQARTLDAVLAFLRERQVLLVVDNCEHVVEAAVLVVEAVLRQAPDVTVLATSREPLHADGERVRRLPSMEMPPDLPFLTASRAMAYPAVQLFVERAEAVLGNFQLTDGNAPAVGELCRRLGGVPLAIELVAARVDVFGVHELVAKLTNRLLLTTPSGRTAQSRHRTLQGLLDWSYDLLTAQEQLVLLRLSVFRGDFNIQAAEAVAAGPRDGIHDILGCLMGLADKSLLIAETSGPEARYYLLDITRTYAAYKLAERPERDRVMRRYAEHLCDQLSIAGDTDAAAACCNIDDVRAALEWAHSPAGQPALAVHLTVMALRLASHHALLGEYRQWLDRANAAAPRGQISAVRKADAELAELMARSGPPQE
ncbi:ATP-binding protein [Uliginosibacterium sp. H1]|uniref:ATP-binding protein n=1 Tax=Uliginosibacterium sp. H1 TaxID=3114757 RepID=UPI002E17F921|nr:winged helix-turn-helix domain-containing protein [Uliginosibacterium sp. H1]